MTTPLPNTVQGGKIIDAAAMTANRTSTVVDLGGKSSVCIQAVVSSGSSPVGTIKVQSSIDGSNWDDIAFANSSGTLVTSISISADGSNTINLAALAAKYLRVLYTFSSGNGTLNVYAHSQPAGR